MTLLPKVKLKVVPTFPSHIIGGTGIATTKQNGAVVIDMDWNEFGLQSSLPTSVTNNVLTFDTATDSYIMVPSHLLGGTVAGIPEAPIDGLRYGRQSEAWTVIPPAGIPEAPNDGTQYGRKSLGWTPITIPPSGISDAPNDGIQYGRQSLGWTAVAGTNFTQAGPSAVTRTMQNKARDIFSVKDFGAVGDGVADDTVAVQAAINALPSSSARLSFPSGTYKLTATLIILNKRAVLQGDGMEVTVLKWTGAGMAGQNGINYSNTQQIPFQIYDMSLVAVPNPAAPTTLAAIGVSASFPAQNTVFEPTLRMERVYIRCDFSGNTWNPTRLGGWAWCVNAVEAGNPNFTNCLFVCNTNANVTYGVRLYSSTNPDYIVFDNCNFGGFWTAIDSYGPNSIGGLVVSNCSFVGVNTGINIETASDMIIVHDTYMQAYTQGIRSIARTTNINNTRIDLNNDPFGRYAPGSSYGIILGNNAFGMDGNIITGNKFGGSASVPMVGISLSQGVQQSIVSNNVFGDTAAFGGTYAIGVALQSGSNDNTVTGNRKCNVTNLISDGGTNNTVYDNLPTAMMPVTGQFPVVKSGQGNVALGKMLYLTQGGATIVLGFTGGFVGQQITLIAGDSNSTIQNNANIHLNGGSNFAMGGNATLTLVYDGGLWRETGRAT